MGGFYIGTQKPSGIYVGTSKVKSLYLGTEKVWSGEPAAVPLCFTANTAGSTVKLSQVGTIPDGYAVQTSTDGTTWSDYTLGASITLTNIGDNVYFRSKNVYSGNFTNNVYLKFTMSGSIAASGNVMSIRYSDFATREALFGDFTFIALFKDCKSLTTAPILPATTLASHCYSRMFNGCTSLTTAPELPAMTTEYYGYEHMFNGCTSLTTAPALPATTLASYCYYYMFYGCTSLTTAPELPATTLVTSCYSSMFYGCTSLTTAPALSATTLASYCYYQMFYGCTSLTVVTDSNGNVTIPDNPGSNVTNMFTNCVLVGGVSATPTAGTYQVGYAAVSKGTETNGTIDSFTYGGKSGTFDTTKIAPNTTVVVNVTPSTGYVLTGATVTGVDSPTVDSTNNTITFTMPNKHPIVTPTFTYSSKSAPPVLHG